MGVPHIRSRRERVFPNTLSRVLVDIVAMLFFLTVAAVVAVWAPDRPVSELRPRWAPPPSLFLNVSGMEVHLRDEGRRDDPIPVVLLHGTSSSLHTWDGWVRALETHRRLIRFDLPGFGLTGPSPDGDYTVKAYVRFVVSVLDSLHVQRCVLAGNSFGGQVAWKTALDRPDLVQKLILVDAAGYPDGNISLPLGFRIARMPLLNRLGEYLLPRFVVQSSLRNLYGNPDRVTPELTDRYYELTLRAGNRAALVERFRQSLPGAEFREIRKLKLPTLVLWGGRDRLLPPENAERFRLDISGSRLILFEELGHLPQEEDPVRTVAAVKQFLGLP